MARPKTDARQRLLVAAVEAAATHGLSALSLRQLAEHLGTSHRMLLFHFGSKDELLLEIVRHVEARQRELLDGDAHDGAVASVGQLDQLWNRLRLPAMWPYERLFFELYAQALHGIEPAVRLLDDVIDPWVVSTTAVLVQAGIDEAVARHEARLALAVCRGLLLDVLATGDIDAVDAAMNRFRTMFLAVHPELGGPGRIAVDR